MLKVIIFHSGELVGLDCLCLSAGSLAAAYLRFGKYFLPLCEGPNTYTNKTDSAFLCMVDGT
jgi:hypothetical protein